MQPPLKVPVQRAGARSSSPVSDPSLPSVCPQGIEREIRDEYEACNNEEYKAARRRWFYLQNKLQYVKALVRRWQAER